jgi:16S rRNA (cytosine1402-N4)-methyltransferase
MHQHRPVLLKEAVDGLHIMSDGTYCDLTFGRGGHSAEILGRLGQKGRLLAMDRDPVAVSIAKEKSEFQDPRFTIVQGEFSTMGSIVSERGWGEQVDGILMDIGVSSPQLDDAQRGFSFLKEGPLDMRMNPDVGMSAADWLNQAPLEDISLAIRDYGEEKFHHRIARAIVKAREETPFSTTLQLADLVEATVPIKEKKKHPATRTFQAIRIFINDELGELKTVLEQAMKVLKVGGRLCVISFHSLEDRIVKQFIKKHTNVDKYPSYLPIRANEIKPRLKKVGSMIRASEAEILNNPRSRSARLRIAEKLL